MKVKIRDWTFTHFWVRPVVKIWFDIYHKSVTYSGEQNVDWDKPIIFAPSHQSAFTDALCLILPARYTNDRFIYPLIRADAFGNSKILDWVLTSFHMMPVYRPKDDVDIKQRNITVFADCHEILSKNRNLLIHPEGNCIPIKRVRRFKKGLARIAFGAESINDFDLDIIVIPVGINYRKMTAPRGGIHVRYGNPIPVTDFEKAYRKHAASGTTEITREVEKGVKEVTVDIQSADHYQLTEEILKLAKSRHPDFTAFAGYPKSEVYFEKEVIKKVEAAEQEPAFLNKIEESIQKIHSLLSNYKLNKDASLVEKYSAWRLLWEGGAYLISLPVFLYGWINNILPWYGIHKIAERIKDRQFINSARMALGLLIFPLCYLIQALAFWYFTKNSIWTLIYVVTIPFAGILSLNIRERWKEWRQQLRLRRLPEAEKSKLFDSIDALLAKLGIRNGAG